MLVVEMHGGRDAKTSFKPTTKRRFVIAILIQQIPSAPEMFCFNAWIVISVWLLTCAYMYCKRTVEKKTICM